MDSLEKSWIEVVNKSWIVMKIYFFLSAYVVESWLGHGRVWLGRGRVWLGHGYSWFAIHDSSTTQEPTLGVGPLW